MTRTAKRATVLSLLSTVAPLVFITGGPILGLLDWPGWLPYLSPTSVMFVGLAGVTPTSTILWASILSIILNALIWVAIGVPALWAALDLPKSLRRPRDA